MGNHLTTAYGEPNIGKATYDQSSMSLAEISNDYYGLPSNPRSIYHTGPAWPLPSGPQAQRIPKETRPVCTHAISAVWHEMGKKIYEYFDSIKLRWTSIDPVRFAEAGRIPGPLFLWVGVLPGTLLPEVAKDAAVQCKEIILQYQFDDIEIAFRESVYARSAGPKLLNHVSPTVKIRVVPSTPAFNINSEVSIRTPFTPALGLAIAPRAFPYFEGTGCLYFCEGSRVLLLTARHVVLPPSTTPNTLYNKKNSSMSRQEVIHLGGWAFQKALKNIRESIGQFGSAVKNYYQELMDLGEPVENEDHLTRQAVKLGLAEAEASKKEADEFHSYITKFWTEESKRILGHIIYAPPISVSVGESMFTEDWALIELNHAKFNWDNFKGNVIYLGGSKLNAYEFMMKMHPDVKTPSSFRYPLDGLMRLQDFVGEDELRHPTMLDASGVACLIVLKNGGATGVTFGRATGIESVVREYKGDQFEICSTSMELAVHPYSHADGAFSKGGDSGSVVADSKGRIVGMITGGAGANGSTDITYVSPYYKMNERIKKVFPDLYLPNTA